MFTASSIPLVYPVALTIDSSNPEVTSFGTYAPDISIFHGLGTDQLGIVSLGSLSSTIQVSSNIQYYLKLERTSSQLVLFAFSDPARTQQIPGSPVFLNFDSTKLPNLNFIQHSGSKSAGPARTITAQITNTTIYQTTLPNGTITTISSSPTGLTARDVSPTQINLIWTAPNNNGNSPITGYKIYRSTSSGTETLLTTSGNFTSYNDTGVTTGITYFYKVTSVNSAGESSQSNEASVTTHQVSSAPQNLSAGTVSSSQINLSWTAPSNNDGSTITSYKIERSTDNGSTWSTIVVNTGSTGTTYSDTGLSSNTTYTYRVSAISSDGTSNPSNTASATTNASTTNGIVLNGIQSTSGTVSSSNQITLANFNAGTGNNRLLVVGVETNNNDVTSITFGGVQLSQAVKSFYNNDAEFWYLKNPVGTGNIVVTTSGSTSAVVGAYSLSGVDQTNPIPTSMTNHTAASSSPTISITTQYPNSLVLDLPSIYGGSTLGSPTCIQQWDVNVPNEITGASSSTVQAKAGSVSCNWTASQGGDLWDDAAIEVKASSP